MTGSTAYGGYIGGNNPEGIAAIRARRDAILARLDVMPVGSDGRIAAAQEVAGLIERLVTPAARSSREGQILRHEIRE